MCTGRGACRSVCTLSWPQIRPPPILVGAATPFKPAALRFVQSVCSCRLSVSCVVFELFSACTMCYRLQSIHGATFTSDAFDFYRS